MDAYVPTMMTGQGRAYADGSLGSVYRDGVLGQVYRDGVLGSSQAFRDGSLGAAAPQPGTVNPLQAKLRMMRQRLSGVGALAPRRARPLTPLQIKILQMRNRLGLRGLGEDDVSVSVSASPTVKVLGILTVVGLSAYGIYRLTK